MNLDMQKDRIVQQINSVSIGGENNAVHHIGIIDTMKDLFVNLLGAIVFSVLGYLYAHHDRKKYRFVRNFIPQKKE